MWWVESIIYLVNSPLRGLYLPVDDHEFITTLIKFTFNDYLSHSLTFS